jgi:hypothetical protein
MKNIVKTLSFFVLTAFVVVSCNNEPAAGDSAFNTDLIKNPATASGELDDSKMPRFEFEEEAQDFGSITQGEKVERIFKFKNVGKTSMIISSAQGSCGCTVPAFPKKPLAPGEEGAITVVYDSNGKSGKQRNTVTILANTYPSTKIISLTGEVIAPDSN